MTAHKLAKNPYKNRMVDLYSCFSSLTDETDLTTLPLINKSIRNNVIVDYFNDVLYSRKAVQVVFLNKANEMFAEDDGLEYMLLNFAGLRKDVAYNLKEERFEKYVEGNPSLIPVNKMNENRYFLSSYNLWLEDGVTEDQINLAGDINHRLMQTLFHLIQNVDMDDNDFRLLFKKK